MLDDRHARVLKALVEEYIQTGQPVSSQAILDRSGLDVSSATIRNDLARLESYGFVQQPHTSAGRIPTDQGYRFYVDHCTPVRLRAATRARIEGFFADVHLELSKLLRETSSLLADLSHYPAVVIGPGIEGEIIHGVHLVRLASQVVLLVTITGVGRVTQEMLHLRFDPSDADLRHAERLVEDHFAGRRIEEVTSDVPELAHESLSDSVDGIVRAVTAALRGSREAASEVFVGGTSRLASLWEDLANVHSVLSLLEREAAVRAMLETEDEGTAVRIGPELEAGELDIAVVSAGYEAGDHGKGRVGVIGPKRMDYRRTIRLVEEVGEGLGDSLGR